MLWMRIAALVTSHNRRETTLGSLAALQQQELPDGVSIELFHVDDGSVDGTTHAVAELFPNAHQFSEDGTKFWNGGMLAAWSAAIRSGPYEGYLWLNDDTVLLPDAVAQLVRCFRASASERTAGPIVVGTCVDPSSGEVTYGGIVKLAGWRPLKFAKVQKSCSAQDCDTMNGNLVLVPSSVVDTLGLLDPSFTHGMADFDYGLRARGTGTRILLAPGVHAECEANPVIGTWRDQSLPLAKRIELITRPTGLPPRDWWRFTRRHGGHLWWAVFLSPYCKLLLTWFAFRVRRMTA